METKAEEFDEIARKVFAPIYPVIAKQIIQRTGIKNGTCLDIGTGGGYLGIALAKITDLSICLFDKSEDMIELANKNIINNGLENKLKALEGDVHKIPFEAASLDLVISRGSVFFWEDLKKAFEEIYRVLKIGGVAYIGGGFGTAELKAEIPKKMKEINREWKGGMIKSFGDNPVEFLNNKLKSAEIENFTVYMDESGLWVIIRR